MIKNGKTVILFSSTFTVRRCNIRCSRCVTRYVTTLVYPTYTYWTVVASRDTDGFVWFRSFKITILSIWTTKFSKLFGPCIWKYTHRMRSTDAVCCYRQNGVVVCLCLRHAVPISFANGTTDWDNVWRQTHFYPTNHVSLVLDGVHHLANAIEQRSVRGGDAALCRII